MEADKGAPSASEASPARLRIGGSWTGVLEVNLSSWTVQMLREEVAARSNRGASPDCINLICGGKILRNGDGAPRCLLELGVKNNSKILANAVLTDRSKAFNDEADRGKAFNDEADRGKAFNDEADRGKAFDDESIREKRLSRIRAAALAFAGRHAGGSLPVEDFNLELENQNGQKVELGTETDRRSLMMGLMLHTNAKSLMKKEEYKDAVDVLAMAEEAFRLCDRKITEMTDNLSILQLDTVWCYFMLRDISWLTLAGMRLAVARRGFERSHGKDSTRFRLLQEGRQTELAIYLRLELLEGVVAYHSGYVEKSRKALSSAQAKYIQLQVPDEALSLLMNMGYKERAAKRALRMNGQDIQCAVDFLVEERAKRRRRHEQDIERQKEIEEQKSYGKTPQNKAVDLQRLNELVSIGFERHLAAEALRLNENDTQAALDVLTNPEKNRKLQHQIQLRENARAHKLAAVAADLLSMSAGDAPQQALTQDQSTTPLTQELGTQGQASTPLTQEEFGSLELEATPDDVDERDEEMEEELVKEMKSDPFEDYDLEVSKEGEAIAEYLALLEGNISE